MPGSTSGSVAGYSFTQRKIIDHGMRRAGYPAEAISAEWIEIAQDLLFLQLSEYVNAGRPLWTQTFGLLGTALNSPDVPCASGTVDVLHAYWRTLNPWRGGAVCGSAPLTDTGGNILFDTGGNQMFGTGGGGGSLTDCSILFGGQPNADVVISGPGPFVQVGFGQATEVDTVGVLMGAGQPMTAALVINISQDGVNFVQFQTLPSATYLPGRWTYFDLDPYLFAPYVQIVAPVAGSWTVNQMNLGLANGQDIEIGPLNLDDYYNLPNKQFSGDRANSAWVQRNIDVPTLKIWPVPDQQAFYGGTVSALTRRYIQDPGSMTNNLEVPARWYEGIVARLGLRLMDTLPDPDGAAAASYFTLMAKQQRRTNLEAAASKAEALMWAEEKSWGPVRWAPNISCYTR